MIAARPVREAIWRNVFGDAEVDHRARRQEACDVLGDGVHDGNLTEVSALMRARVCCPCREEIVRAEVASSEAARVFRPLAKSISDVAQQPGILTLQHDAEFSARSLSFHAAAKLDENVR
jgi:hypothetical protein